MAVAPQLSDVEITCLLEIPHPAKAIGESIYATTKVCRLGLASGAIVSATWMF